MTAVELAFDDEGGGPCVVLVHGHPFDRTMWEPQRAALSGSFRVVSPDLRGYGDSPVTVGAVTMAQLADDVAALLDRLGVGRAALVGLSMGGLVVMELAIADPERWWAIGLVATTVEPTGDSERADRLATADRAEREGMKPLADAMIGKLFGPNADPQTRKRITATMLATDPRGAAAALRGRAERPDYRRALGELELPTFVCVGDHDPFSTQAVTERLVANLRNPRVVTLEGTGHMPNLEATERFDAELRAFLLANAPAQRS